MWVYFEDFNICLGDQAYQVVEAVMTLQGTLYPEARTEEWGLRREIKL